MFRRPAFAVAVLALAVADAPAHAAVVIDTIGGTEIAFEGLLQADANWYDSDVLDLASGDNGRNKDYELRRAELVLKGEAANHGWVLGYDAKADRFLDNNIRWRIGDGGLRIGQYKQPNSLEELSSTRHNDFISKAAATNTFGVARRLGVAYDTSGDAWTLTASAFGRELTRDQAEGNGYGARFTWAPMNATGHILHLGVSAVRFQAPGDVIRLRARPQADLAGARLVDTGELAADHIRTFGLESMYVHGPFKLQAEYMRARVDGIDGDDFDGDSWYVSGLWNLTGETWSYRNGVPSTPEPDAPARGLWQLGLRYDRIDLDDGAVRGGAFDAVTAGVNWYLRSNFKLMLNYVAVDSRRAGIDDAPNIVEARAQFHW
ncbi:OprO/OprP family phosphate-selective porin [Coralloluteibacterium thermophilus]|uniref:OprO/OprP family phosphate-selective porin n=1 Tax=Coralloluteibacterium thermophilum TaxID=2707049 RepID=A0ABV9NMR2_9GAMM